MEEYLTKVAYPFIARSIKVALKDSIQRSHKRYKLGHRTVSFKRKKKNLVLAAHSCKIFYKH